MKKPEYFQGGKYFLSDVVQHTDKKKGYWMAIDNWVYDLSKFIHRHPGGNIILEMHVGLDASYEFKKVGHYKDTSVLSMMKKYRVGEFIAIQFTDKEKQRIYSNWSKTLSLCTEMINALTLDICNLDKVFIPAEKLKGKASPLNQKLIYELLKRFKEEYMHSLVRKLSECSKEDISRKEIKSIMKKNLSEFQFEKPDPEAGSKALDHDQKEALQKLSKGLILLQALKGALVEVNRMWEQSSNSNSYSFMPLQSKCEQKLISTLRVLDKTNK